MAFTKFKTNIFLGGALALLAATAPAAAESPARNNPPSVLLISIDALSPQYVLNADKMGLHLPNLRNFLTEGSYAEGARNVVPSVTCPAHASLVTGVSPSVHGIIANQPLQNDGFGSILCTFASDIKVDALYDAAARNGITSGAVGWLNTAGSRSITYNLPYTDPYNSHIAVKLQESMSHPHGLLMELQKKLGSYYQNNDESGSDTRLRFATEIMNRYKPGFMMFHTVSLDSASHKFGPWSVEAKKAAEHEDRILGQIMQTALRNDPDTIIAVVSDHGQMPYHHVLNLNIALVDAGLITLAPLKAGTAVKIQDWQAQRFNDAVLLKDPNDMATHAKVRGVLQRLAADPENGINRILEGQEVAELGGYPGASFVLDMKAGTVLGSALLGDLLVQHENTRGTHGYLPHHTGMNASFFIKGKNIKQGHNLGQINLLDIAPTIARAMQVELKDAQRPALPVFEK